MSARLVMPAKLVRLSPHFTLLELCHTNHRFIDNTPSPEQVERLRALAVQLLEPLRQRFGPLYASSGFRARKLNTAIGGAKRSAHLDGHAGDMIPLRAGVTIAEMIRWLRDESGLVWDQAIDECNAKHESWLHIALPPVWLRGPARQQCKVWRPETGYTNFPPLRGAA